MSELLSRHWIAGSAVALGGALLARFVAPNLPLPLAQIWVKAAGISVAGLGLLWIAVGTRNRSRERSE